MSVVFVISVQLLLLAMGTAPVVSTVSMFSYPPNLYVVEGTNFSSSCIMKDDQGNGSTLVAAFHQYRTSAFFRVYSNISDTRTTIEKRLEDDGRTLVLNSTMYVQNVTLLFPSRGGEPYSHPTVYCVAVFEDGSSTVIHGYAVNVIAVRNFPTFTTSTPIVTGGRDDLITLTCNLTEGIQAYKTGIEWTKDGVTLSTCAPSCPRGVAYCPVSSTHAILSLNEKTSGNYTCRFSYKMKNTLERRETNTFVVTMNETKVKHDVCDELPLSWIPSVVCTTTEDRKENNTCRYTTVCEMSQGIPIKVDLVKSSLSFNDNKTTANTFLGEPIDNRWNFSHVANGGENKQMVLSNMVRFKPVHWSVYENCSFERNLTVPFSSMCNATTVDEVVEDTDDARDEICDSLGKPWLPSLDCIISSDRERSGCKYHPDSCFRHSKCRLVGGLWMYANATDKGMVVGNDTHKASAWKVEQNESAGGSWMQMTTSVDVAVDLPSIQSNITWAVRYKLTGAKSYDKCTFVAIETRSVEGLCNPEGEEVRPSSSIGHSNDSRLSSSASRSVRDVQADCISAMDAGDCMALETRYWFNGTSCVKFYYGGCKGNANNYPSKVACANACGGQMQINSTTVTPSIPTLSLLPTTHSSISAFANGNWGGWSAWSRCSLSCGGGVRERTRQCDNPPPSGQGHYCTGKPTERDGACNNQSCHDTVTTTLTSTAMTFTPEFPALPSTHNATSTTRARTTPIFGFSSMGSPVYFLREGHSNLQKAKDGGNKCTTSTNLITVGIAILCLFC